MTLVSHFCHPSHHRPKGRNRMPHNNRMSSSAALRTNGEWKSLMIYEDEKRC